MPNYRKKVKEIIDANLCVGCGLCEGISNGKVTMTYNHEGFLRPDKIVEDEKAAEEIVQSCPGYRLELPPTTKSPDPVWGNLYNCRTGHATSKLLRLLGYSGGGLSALISTLLEHNFADNVIHITTDVNHPIHNKIQISTELSTIKRAAGSRYCPSAPLAAIPSLLDKDKRSILVGKPCDIAGARQYLDNNTEYKDQVVLLVSFMCGGMPSIEGTREILRHFKMEEDELSDFRFRGDGWPGKVKAETKDGQMAFMSYDQSWGEILRNYTQFRCKII